MIQQDNRPKTLRDYLRLFFTGIAMGAADIVPGVSGGTMAFILGVYEDLLNGIKSVDINVIKLLTRLKIREALDMVPWQFLITLGLGIGIAILSLSRILTNILDNEPEYLFAFFFGLVIASIIAIGIKIEGWTPQIWAALAAGAIIALVIVTRTPSKIEANLINLFFSGMLAIMAMILPGISGSFILLILGQYDNVLNAVKDFEIAKIMAVGLGCIVGLALFARLLSWLLENYRRVVIATLVGFMIGSLYKIWPWKKILETDIDRHGEIFTTKDQPILPEFASSEFLIALGLCIIGFIIVTALDHLQSRSNPVVLAFTGLFRSRNTTIEPQAE
jgi:putative membrane protein